MIEAHDIAFAFDALLLAYSDGVIRVYGLEMAWAEMSKLPKRQLKYALSHGMNLFTVMDSMKFAMFNFNCLTSEVILIAFGTFRCQWSH